MKSRVRWPADRRSHQQGFGTYVARQTKPMVIRMNTKKIHWLAAIQTSPPYFRITHVLFATSLAIKIMSIMAAGLGFRKSRIATSQCQGRNSNHGHLRSDANIWSTEISGDGHHQASSRGVGDFDHHSEVDGEPCDIRRQVRTEDSRSGHDSETGLGSGNSEQVA